MNAAHITVVIVAWNQVAKTLDCLATVAALDTPPDRVLLVDNGSAPPLAAIVNERFPAVEILRLADNRGFAGGYNAGIARALDGGAAAVLLLN
ncbi:MAG: glycosyltransferase family 2 protein, partial [Candidatus Promineofilum sp.]|nr:glycosyltransferase family 2 protein [Promineifilum sp.]